MQNELKYIKKNIEKLFDEQFINIEKKYKINLNKNVLNIEFKDEILKEIFVDNVKSELVKAYKNKFNKKIIIKFVSVDENNDKKINQIPKDETIYSIVPKDKNFDNFIVSKFNRDAFKSVKNIIINQNKENIINPLYIYGNSGLGKSHLLYSFINLNKKMKITYFDCLDFVNIFDNNSYNFNEEKLTKKILNTDIFILDDIQFIPSDKNSKRKLLYFLNNFILRNRYFIITSNVSPTLLNSLDDRIISRIEDGLIINLNTPNPDEIRKFISNQLNVLLPNILVKDEVIEVLSNNFYQNIRKINGYIKKISFYFFDSKFKEINLNFIKKYLPEINIKNNRHIKPNEIIVFEEVSNFLNISEDLIFSRKRTKEVLYSKKLICYILYVISKDNIEYIKSLFFIKTDDTVKKYINFIEQELDKKDIQIFLNKIRKRILNK